jgi:hypothetical protein
MSEETKDPQTEEVVKAAPQGIDFAKLLESSGDLAPVDARPEGLGIQGLEGIRADEMKLPRLAIAQGLSPQLVPDDAAFIPGLVIGQMFNDVTKDIYGTGPVRVVPVLRHVTRIEFDPNDRKRPLDRNVPWNDPRMKWTGNEPPRATEFVEFVCLALRAGKMPDKVVVSIKTTNKQQRDAAMLWTTYVNNRNADIFSGIYELTTKIARGTNRKGEPTMYAHFVVNNRGFVPKATPAGAAVYAFAKEFADQLKISGFGVDREAEDADSFDAASFENAQV